MTVMTVLRHNNLTCRTIYPDGKNSSRVRSHAGQPARDGDGEKIRAGIPAAIIGPVDLLALILNCVINFSLKRLVAFNHNSKMKNQDELELPGEGVPEGVVAKAKRILKLMENATSLSVVGEFLKSKQVHHSAGSWQDLEEKRILPALRSGKISLEELNQLLGESEEFGRCHIFLFAASKADVARYLDPKQIAKTSERLGIEDALKEVIIEELPDEPKITQIREENANGQSGWVFKIVEKREQKTFMEEVTEGDTYTKKYKVEHVRALNIVKLHESGLLELRIQSRANSNQYDSDLTRVWTLLRDFLPTAKFSELYLRKAKARLLDDRETLKEKIRFSDSTLKDKNGNTIVASTGTETEDLFEGSGVGSSLDQFQKNGGYCDSSNIWFREREGAIAREVHVLLSGRSNEFAINASCSRIEYEYVLNELRAINK